VASTTNLREALAYIIQKKPQYVMISADHANKKVRVLPRMLAQAFPLRVIGFAEKSSGLSTKALQDLSLEYNLHPPVSGPAIERMILKIRKDEEAKAQQADQLAKNPRTGADADGTEDVLTFRGETASVEAMKASFEQARAALSQLISSDTASEEGATVVGDSFKQSSGSIVQQGIGFEAGAAYMGSASQQNATLSATQTGPDNDLMSANQAGVLGQSLMAQGTVTDPENAFRSGKNQSSVHTGTGLGSGGTFVPFPEKDEDSNSSDWKTNSDRNSDQVEDSQDQDSSNYQRKAQTTPIMESEYQRRDTKAGYTMETEDARRALNHDSIIVRGAQQALDESVIVKNKNKPEAVKQASNLACITIQSPKFSGYLVCALGKNKKADKSLMDAVQKRLFAFLKNNGEKVEEKDTMNLQIQQVDFTDWALEQAEFLRKSIHDGDEIAMAFFPTKDIDVQLEESASQKMVQLDINELKTDVPLEFDLYIFMPENNKYLLYTPQGQPLQGGQKGRLSEKGITHMHLRKETAHNVKKFKAQNFLNEKIAAYKASKKH